LSPREELSFGRLSSFEKRPPPLADNQQTDGAGGMATAKLVRQWRWNHPFAAQHDSERGSDQDGGSHSPPPIRVKNSICGITAAMALQIPEAKPSESLQTTMEMTSVEGPAAVTTKKRYEPIRG
jgi:hypothetical protein